MLDRTRNSSATQSFYPYASLSILQLLVKRLIIEKSKRVVSGFKGSNITHGSHIAFVPFLDWHVRTVEIVRQVTGKHSLIFKSETYYQNLL